MAAVKLLAFKYLYLSTILLQARHERKGAVSTKIVCPIKEVNYLDLERQPQQHTSSRRYSPTSLSMGLGSAQLDYVLLTLDGRR